MNQELVPYEKQIGALTVADVRAQVNLIQHIMQEVMKKDEHYGVIPGTGTKPTLLKAGAEKLCLTFRLDPQYEIEQKQEGTHLTIVSKCTLWHIPSGQRFGSGMGSCSTKESKYAYRQGKRKCPNCGAEAIMRSKFPPKNAPNMEPGWYCFQKTGGCGAQFDHDDKAITGQQSGRISNEDIADQYNTVLKMANKRSLVAAVLNATAASDIFTQDIEDMVPQDQATGGNLPKNAVDTQAAAPSASGGPVSLEQAMNLAQGLSECDPQAEAAFLKAAKLDRLDALQADDYSEAMDWIMRRKAKRKAA